MKMVRLSTILITIMMLATTAYLNKTNDSSVEDLTNLKARVNLEDRFAYQGSVLEFPPFF